MKKQAYFTPYITIISLLKQGVSPKELALGLSLGGTLGVIPLLGVSSVLSLILAWTLQLNIVAVQAANYLADPLQIVLMGVYFTSGAWLFGQGDYSASVYDSLALVRSNLMGALSNLKDYALYATTVWVLTSPFIAILIYIPFRFIADKLSRKPRF